MIRAAKGNGVRLLVYLYLMCSFLTYFTSNDIVIISMTPIVVHTCSEGIQDCVPLVRPISDRLCGTSRRSCHRCLILFSVVL
jgi:Na+/H+ antiporter NhaD/arsenite permease-like protein